MALIEVSSDNESVTSTSANLIVSYGTDDNKLAIGAIQSINFLRYKGEGSATINRIVFDGQSLEDFFGTPDEPLGNNLYIEDKNIRVTYCFSKADVESVNTYVSVNDFALYETMVLKTESPVKRIRI